MDDLKFDIVPSTVPVTGTRGPRGGLQNLDFEK
jgi:hypothetical protein